MRICLIRTLCGLLVSAPLSCAPRDWSPHESGDRSAINPAAFGELITSANDQYLVAFRAMPDPIPLNEPFQMRVHVFRNAQPPQAMRAVDLAVDARMPHHRHGMNREPRITALAEGEFLVENMLLHMPGYWELYFDIVRDGVTERAQTSLELE